MGHHYVPQYYLRGFSADANSLWVFDKVAGRAFETQVKSIANETGFYSPEMESYLANRIEGPANQILQAIRERKPLTNRDKEILSAYMICMLKRVPSSHDSYKQMLPSIARERGEEYDRQLREAAKTQPEYAETFEQRRAEIRELVERYTENPPKEIWLENIPPEMSPNILAALSRMTWRFLTSDGHPAFLASDSPLFYFSHLGIGSPASEVTFPIASDVALWATWRGDVNEGYFPARDSWIQELNRRTVSGATRCAFHQLQDAWVLRLLSKPKLRLRALA